MPSQDQSVPLDWKKKSLPENVSQKCRDLLSEAVGEGWREVAGTVLLDENDTVVGFRMHLTRNGKESKEVVVPATPELSVKVEEPYAVKKGYVSQEGADKAHPKREAELSKHIKRLNEKKGTNPWAK